MTHETEFKATDYITLKQFQGGWIWIKNITTVSNQILPHLSNLSIEQVRAITDLLNGRLMPWQIFDDTQWVLRLIPLPEFEMLIVYNNNEEFGPDLKLFYHKTSLKVPTEDSYVFLEYYLELLGILAKHGIEKAISTQFQGELINLNDLLEIVDPTNKKKTWYDIIGQREEPLLKIDKKTAEQISSQLKVPLYTDQLQASKIQWSLKFDLLKNVSIYPSLSPDGNSFEVFYTKNVLNFQSRRILFFTWLYCNAIIREARLILGDALPKLSKYL